MQRSTPLVTVFAIFFASAALGGDGRTEISQAAVLAGGGFPYLISQSGSYVLTSNLTVADPDTDAIQVAVDDVSIDLNGFAISGPVTCSGGGAVPVSCSPAGQGSAIVSDDPANANAPRSNLIVRNGTLRGFGRYGVSFVFTDFGLLIQDVTIVDMDDAATLLLGGIVRNSVFRRTAIVILLQGVVSEVAVTDTRFGLGVWETVVAQSALSRSNSRGLNVYNGGVVVANTVRDNATIGIQCTPCLANGNAIDQNGTDGISMGSNGGFFGAYTNNVINDHPGGDPVSGGFYLFPNVCDGSTASSVCDPP